MTGLEDKFISCLMDLMPWNILAVGWFNARTFTSSSKRSHLYVREAHTFFTDLWIYDCFHSVKIVRSFGTEIETGMQNMTLPAEPLLSPTTFFLSTVSARYLRCTSPSQHPHLFFSNSPSESQMREVINIHVGQAGVQIGNSCCKSNRKAFLLIPTH